MRDLAAPLTDLPEQLVLALRAAVTTLLSPVVNRLALGADAGRGVSLRRTASHSRRRPRSTLARWWHRSVAARAPAKRGAARERATAHHRFRRRNHRRVRTPPISSVPARRPVPCRSRARDSAAASSPRERAKAKAKAKAKARPAPLAVRGAVPIPTSERVYKTSNVVSDAKPRRTAPSFVLDLSRPALPLPRGSLRLPRARTGKAVERLWLRDVLVAQSKKEKLAATPSVLGRGGRR